jgi:hypothetical protein
VFLDEDNMQDGQLALEACAGSPAWTTLRLQPIKLIQLLEST